MEPLEPQFLHFEEINFFTSWFMHVWCFKGTKQCSDTKIYKVNQSNLCWDIWLSIHLNNHFMLGGSWRNVDPFLVCNWSHLDALVEAPGIGEYWLTNQCFSGIWSGGRIWCQVSQLPTPADWILQWTLEFSDGYEAARRDGPEVEGHGPASQLWSNKEDPFDRPVGKRCSSCQNALDADHYLTLHLILWSQFGRLATQVLKVKMARLPIPHPEFENPRDTFFCDVTGTPEFIRWWIHLMSKALHR